jgi:preprotein translocase subunit Sec61beta
MAKDSKIRMPSGQGGLTRYFEESTSKLLFSPGAVIVLCVVVGIVIILLHYIGGMFIG